MEDAWFNLLDKLDSIGVPVYAVITPLEDAGVPTMWFTIAIIVLLLGALAVTVMPQRTVSFDITVTSGGEPLAGANVHFGTLTKKTSSTGHVTADIAYGDTVELVVTHPDCELSEKTFPAKDDYKASIELRCST
jgi:hypothetical protein